mgnify:CR=1 FL=1
MTDRYFDQIGAHFARKIYASPKGAIRLAVLTRDLEQWLPELNEGERRLRVLDVGAGLGHVSEWLLLRGHQLTVSEPWMLPASACRHCNLRILRPTCKCHYRHYRKEVSSTTW